MKNNDWRSALDDFLKDWKDRDEVVGAIVTGSRVAGTATPLSNIDVHILLFDDCNWKERGNRTVDSFIVEYFANPIYLLKEYDTNDYEDNQRSNARMLAVGEILFDKTGEVAKLQENARAWMKIPFKKPSALFIEERKYWLRDSLDGLKDLSESRSSAQSLVYYSHLSLLLSIYCSFIGAEMPHLTKAYKLLTDPEFGKRYHFKTFPDQSFASMFIEALSPEIAEQFEVAESITQYVLERMGGFDIDNWTLRTPIGSDEV